MALDEIDTRLLSALREDSRRPVALMARAVGLSRTAVQARITRLERQKVIAAYTIVAGDGFERRLMQAHVLVKVGPKHVAAIETAVREVPEVRSLLSVSGEFDMIVVIASESVQRLDSVINEVGRLDGVERISSAVTLSELIAR
jgi:DNA-binding Lrp family transcriptional regulator